MGRYDDDEDAAEAPKSSRRTAVADDDEELDAQSDRVKVDRKKIQRGWGNAEQVKAADSPFAQRLKVEKAAQVVKFLESEPYTSYHQHWLDDRKGQKSFTCIRDLNAQGCPLCDAGDRPAARFGFNVVLLTDSDPVLKSYDVGPRIIDQLKNFNQDPKVGPLDKHYWAISKTGTGGTAQTNHQMVKATDLEDDWPEVSVPTEEQLKALFKKKYDEEIVYIPKYKDLKSIAAEELGD